MYCSIMVQIIKLQIYDTGNSSYCSSNYPVSGFVAAIMKI